MKAKNLKKAKLWCLIISLGLGAGLMSQSALSCDSGCSTTCPSMSESSSCNDGNSVCSSFFTGPFCEDQAKFGNIGYYDFDAENPGFFHEPSRVSADDMFPPPCAIRRVSYKGERF